MIRTTLLLVIIFFSLEIQGQDTVNVTDSQGRRQGYWNKRDTAGRLVYEGRFRDGKPVGEFRYYYPDGKLKTLSKMSENGRKARTVSFFPNGKRMAAGNYLDEKKDSTWVFYSESMGTVVSRESYRAGIREGISRIYYPAGPSGPSRTSGPDGPPGPEVLEGPVAELHYYKNGILDGLWEQYFTDGKLKLRGAYKAGEKQGVFKLFFPDGRVMLSGQYQKGHQDGDWIYYDEKGGIRKTETYRLGELIRVNPPE